MIMKGKFNIRDIQNINFFEKITKIKVRSSFSYNNMIVFVIPRQSLRKFPKEKLNYIINQIGKFKIIAFPKDNSEREIDDFFSNLIYPLAYKNIEIDKTNQELNIYATPKAKPLLIGREKVRIKELSNIAEMFFNIPKVNIR